ncbi:hypothetical protein F5X99DRAFT_329390 [Biscogniauxia marginata]|nr:hypothetical protein F5X99DRAFT_329390 [Biscogniauxia marginata]
MPARAMIRSLRVLALFDFGPTYSFSFLVPRLTFCMSSIFSWLPKGDHEFRYSTLVHKSTSARSCLCASVSYRDGSCTRVGSRLQPLLLFC